MIDEIEDYVKKIGKRKYLDELWSKVDDEVEHIHKRLGDTPNHPTCEEVDWFHHSFMRLYKVLGEYQSAEFVYLPQEEQPRVKTDDPAVIKGGVGIKGTMIDIDEMNTQEAETYESGEAPDQSEEIKRRYGGGWHLSKNIEFLAPDRNSLACSILSHAIQDVENLGGFKVIAAIVDLNKDTDLPIKDRIQCYSTVESQKLREAIYKEIEKEM